MKKIDRAKKIVIFTVLALGAIYIADYSESGAKYYKNVETGVTYDFGLAKLTTDNLGSFSARKDLSEYDKLYLEYSVPRNLIMGEDDTTDTYRVVVDNGCKIEKVNGSSVTATSNSYTLTYSDATAKNISVAYTCPVDKIETSSTSDFMSSSVLVYEQMSTDVKEFLYTKNTEVFKKSDVLPQPIVDDYHLLTILSTDTLADISTKVSEWISNNKNEFYKNYPESVLIYNQATLNVIEKYLSKAYTTDIRNFNSSAIRGITFNDDGSGTYTYVMSEDFFGYAVTDNLFNVNTHRNFYISNVNQDDAILNALFEDYVATYLFASGSSDYNDLIDYINQKGGIASVINGTNKIPGIVYSVTGRIEIDENIMNYVNPLPEPVVIDVTGKEPSEITTSLANGLISNYGDILIDSLYPVFLENDYDFVVASFFRKNSTFNDYLIYDFGGSKVVINISSDGSGKIVATASSFVDSSLIDFSTATTISLATNYDGTDITGVVDRINDMASVINSSYASIVTSSMITTNQKGLYADSSMGVIKAYLINKLDELGFGSLLPSTTTISDILNDGEEINITDDPDKVNAGDTPNDEEEEAPIFEDMVTLEPTDTVTSEVNDSEKVEEDPIDEETEEDLENGKNADTDIEKEFVKDIEEISELIEDMKDFVGDASKEEEEEETLEVEEAILEVEELIEDAKEFVGDASDISEEEEAILEVDELIETVKDYIEEA